jgi:hypothetical protein
MRWSSKTARKLEPTGLQRKPTRGSFVRVADLVSLGYLAWMESPVPLELLAHRTLRRGKPTGWACSLANGR